MDGEMTGSQSLGRAELQGLTPGVLGEIGVVGSTWKQQTDLETNHSFAVDNRDLNEDRENSVEIPGVNGKSLTSCYSVK
ncbi:hypothetical protein INR49_001802 [Caranx melampygus]|nr:hypothetical protein INR49_001802 [Caranx melampygus]